MKEKKSKKMNYIELLNEYDQFKHTYHKIRKDFKFNRKKDEEAQSYLNQLFTEKRKNWELEEIIHNFHKIIQKKSIISIYGAGPSLAPCVNKIIETSETNVFQNTINLAADGASIFLRQKNIPIHGIFTDLDGITPQEFEYGKYLIVHAHGDNIQKLKAFKEKIIKKENVIGTCQVKPEYLITNPGGFTDGDRILFFIRNLLHPSQKLCLLGMDFGSSVGQYSKPNFQENQKANTIKLKKLSYAKDLIEDIINKIPNECYFVEPQTKYSQFKTISINQYRDLIRAS